MPRGKKQVADGDSRFDGIAPRLDPASLPEGMASEARNMRFRNGVAESRKGMFKPPWANSLAPEIDNKVRPFGEVHGVGVFRNPKNLEFAIIAADNTVFYTRQNNNPIELTLPDGVSITGTVNFTQAFNKMIMWRGEDFAPLVMSSEDTGFEDLVEQYDITATYDSGDQVAFGPLVAVDSATVGAFINGATIYTTTVTTSSDHGYLTGADVTIAGANEAWYNGRYNITVTATNKFTFTPTEVGVAVGTATGTITATNNQDYYEAMNPPATALNGELIAPLDTALDGALFAPPFTALNGAIDDDPTTTTIIVDSTSGYPASGNILIGSENISYTAKTGTQFSGGDRAQDDTTIAAHADDVTVAFVQPTIITVDSTTDYPDAGTFKVATEKITYTATTATTFTGCARAQAGTTVSAHDDDVAVSFVHGTTVTVDATTGYPATGTIVVGAEKITYTGTTATTFTGCTRGEDSTAIVAHLDNATVSSVAVATTAGDSPVSQVTRWGDGTTTGKTLGTIMPNSTHGVFIANRVVAPTKYDADPTTTAYGNHRQFIMVSNSLDHVHSYWNQIFRCNFGTDSEIQDLLVYDENRLLIFSDKNVMMMTSFITTNVNATLGDSVSIQPVVQRYGVPTRGAAVAVGSDVYFYASRRGVTSLSQTEESKVRGVDLPLSEPIQPLIDRIDPRYESSVRLAYWDNKLWVAAPLSNLDGSATDGSNNSLLVFDFLVQKWVSHDSGPAINPVEFFHATYNGSMRLFYIGADGFINLVGENDAGDDLADLTQDDGLATTDFESYLLTRGYHANDTDHRDFKAASVSVATWNSNFTLATQTDGVNESQTLVSGRTKSRFNYYRPFDAAPFIEHNNNGDHANPYREDYSVQLDVAFGNILTEAGDTIAVQTADDAGESIGLQHEAAVGGFVLGTDGVQFNRFQETLEPFALAPRMGRYTQIEMSNTRGRIKVTQATLTNQVGDRTIGVQS